MGKLCYTPAVTRRMNRAMLISLGVGFLMLFLKVYAYVVTGSAAIFSDAAESVVHVFAVGFAAYSMWLSHKPADKDHTYGHDRIIFFSAGFEGTLILIASLFIFYEAIQKLISGVPPENLDAGMLFISIATILNGFLGTFLIRQGRRYHSLVLEADGKHIFADCITSLSIIVALIFTKLTSWAYLDPLIALIVGGNIFITGAKLIYHAADGLMDRVDTKTGEQIRVILEKKCQEEGIEYRHLRHRNAGNRLMIEVHFIFKDDPSLSCAHEIATRIEGTLEQSFTQPTEIVSHLAPALRIL